MGSGAFSPHFFCLVLDGVPKLEHLTPMPVTKLLRVALYPASELVLVIVKSFPGRLAGHANGCADHFPRSTSGNCFSNKLGFPR